MEGDGPCSRDDATGQRTSTEDYENGFGNVKGEHWLGLKKISCLTSVEVKTKLRIDLADFAGHSKFAYYAHFRVGNPNSNYKLTIYWRVPALGARGSRGQHDEGPQS